MAAFRTLSCVLLAAAAPALAQVASPSPGPPAYLIKSTFARGGCVGPANSISGVPVPMVGTCPQDPDGIGCVAGPGNMTSTFYGACMSGVPAPAIAVPTAAPAQPVPGTMVVTTFEQPRCAGGVNKIDRFNVTQLGVCINSTKATYNCIGSSVLVTYYTTSSCSGAPVATQLWPSGCVAQLPTQGLGSTFISGCQTARGPGQTYNPEVNATSAKAALIVPLFFGALILCMTSVVYFRRKAAASDAVKLVDASRSVDARVAMQEMAPPPLPPKGRHGGGH